MRPGGLRGRRPLRQQIADNEMACGFYEAARPADKVRTIAIPTEHQEQKALIDWWALACGEFGIDKRYLFAIPSGGAREAITGALLKAEGVRPGVPDLCLAWPRTPYHGLYIEMKRVKGGTVSPEQAEYVVLFRAAGYRTAVCRGFAAAQFVITSYLTQLGMVMPGDD